jgi:signal transduction histidine kinase
MITKTRAKGGRSEKDDLTGDTVEDATHRVRHAAIERAKLEWECTVDALAELVCLLGSDGRVIRANRVVENWMLGPVAESRGKPVHDLLHPRCTADHCDLRRRLRDALRELRSGSPMEFDYHEASFDRRLNFVLRPLQVDGKRTSTVQASIAVLVVSDVSELNEARAAIERFNVDLEARVVARTRELAEANGDLRNEVARRERAEKALRESSAERAQLSEQLIKAQEGERKRIALELHDSVGQSISAIKYTIERALEMCRQPRLGSPEPVLALAVKRIQDAADSIRSISMNLRPQILDNLGVASAVQWLCGEFAEVYRGITVHAEVAITDGEIPERLTTVVFRCVEELMNNVAKHAQARTVWVSVSRNGELVSLEVRDDGIGMPPSDTHRQRMRGTGLSSLRERAQMSGGELLHSSVPGAGTRARMVWRLTSDEAKLLGETGLFPKGRPN